MSVIDTATHWATRFALPCVPCLAFGFVTEKMKLSLDVVRRCANEQPNIIKVLTSRENITREIVRQASQEGKGQRRPAGESRCCRATTA